MREREREEGEGWTEGRRDGGKEKDGRKGGWGEKIMGEE